jgi:hypothetical protein
MMGLTMTKDRIALIAVTAAAVGFGGGGEKMTARASSAATTKAYMVSPAFSTDGQAGIWLQRDDGEVIFCHFKVTDPNTNRPGCTAETNTK